MGDLIQLVALCLVAVLGRLVRAHGCCGRSALERGVTVQMPERSELERAGFEQAAAGSPTRSPELSGLVRAAKNRALPVEDVRWIKTIGLFLALTVV